MKGKRPVLGIGFILFVALVFWALMHAGFIG